MAGFWTEALEGTKVWDCILKRVGEVWKGAEVRISSDSLGWTDFEPEGGERFKLYPYLDCCGLGGEEKSGLIFRSGWVKGTLPSGKSFWEPEYLKLLVCCNFFNSSSSNFNASSRSSSNGFNEASCLKIF